ncbi:MAG: DUF2062 domain-containing protein [Planctomycetota bacterium]|jgi:uncharacterized protein (TIGR03546 family)
MFIPIPKPIRKYLAILRGGVSPVIIFLSVMLGFTFGLIPAWSGIHVIAIALIFILNIHIGIFLISAGLGKAICFGAAPVLYHIGAAVEGYLTPLVKLLAAIPIIAITDFGRYAVTGAVVCGPIVGAAGGLLLARTVIGFRRKMLKLEEGSEKFQKWYSNRWVRILDRILIGKRTKDAKALFSAKAKIVRKAGVAIAVILLVIFGVVASLLKDTKVRDYAVARLTKANGAEVNLETLKLSALTGHASASGIQITDAENPQNNQVAVDKIAADASVYNLLLGRVVVDQVLVSNVQFNQRRQTPGRVAEIPAEQPGIFDPCDFKVTVSDIGKMEKYLENAKAVREWLQKLGKWLPKSEEQAAAEEQPVIKYLDYLLARSDAPPSPRFLAKNMLLEKVEIPSLVFGNSTITLQNINDAPQNAGLPIKLEIKSNDTPMRADVTFDYSASDKPPQVTGAFSGLDLSTLQSSLSSGAGLAFESGVASGQFNGQITADFVDLTVDIDIKNMQASAQGDGVLGLGGRTTSEAFKVLKDLKTTIRVVGPVSEPRLAFDVKGLQGSIKEALVKAGQQRLSEEIDKQLGDRLGDKVPEEIKDVLKKPKDLLDSLGGLLGGKKE